MEPLFPFVSSQVSVDGTDGGKEATALSSIQSITSESSRETSGTSITTTTTHISKVRAHHRPHTHLSCVMASDYFSCPRW